MCRTKETIQCFHHSAPVRYPARYLLPQCRLLQPVADPNAGSRPCCGGTQGHARTLEAGFANAQHERARSAAARLIHAEPSDIALIPSISYGVATAAKLLTLGRGTRVIGWKAITPRRCWNGRRGPKRKVLPSRRFGSLTTATGHRRCSPAIERSALRRSAWPRSHRCTGRMAG